MLRFEDKATYKNERHIGSDRYSMVQTGALIELVRGQGYEVTDYSEASTRKFDRRGLQRHVVRMCQPGFALSDTRPELVIINSYDKSKALTVKLGFFRFVCSNGLIAGDSIAGFKSKHMGFDYDGLLNFVANFKKLAEKGSEKIEMMKDRRLNKDEQVFLATSAWMIRHDVDQKKISEMENDKRVDFFAKLNSAVPALLTARRVADNNDDAWSVFNRVQENILRGRRGRFQAVRSVNRQVDINEQLWQETETLVAS